MSADPNTVPAPSWAQRNRPLVAAALALLAAAVGSVLTRYGVAPRTVEVITETIREAPLPLSADPRPIDYEGIQYHGDHHDEHGPQKLQAQAARWPADRITYSIDYASARGMSPPLSDDAIRAAIRQATGWWADNLQLEFVEVTSGAMIPIRFERIDGPAGVLAEAYLADGTNRPKPLRFDSSERWTPGAPATNLVSLPTVACHEIGHSLGCPHDAANAAAVMRPTYTASLPREQERDIQRMVGLGYKRREKVPPAATDVLTFPIQARTDDVVDALKKAGYGVTKP